MGDKGCINLTIPVHAYNNIPVKDVTIYDSSWQREHLRTIKTCYGSAPYFPYVIDKIEDLFYIKGKWLIDLNNIILERLLSIINYDISIEFTKEFSPIVQNDSRLITHRNYKSEYIFREYYQVFSEIQPFEPNLSIIDYLMCEGFSL